MNHSLIESNKVFLQFKLNCDICIPIAPGIAGLSLVDSGQQVADPHRNFFSKQKTWTGVGFGLYVGGLH